MKTLIISFITVCAFCLGSSVFADVIEVPVVVDSDGNTYTVSEGVAVPTSGDYYYVYSGHRCYTSVQTTMNGSYVVYKGSPDIYCYNYPEN